MSRISKEQQKKMLIKQTINMMNKQIQKLEDQKQTYINSGKEAHQRGLTSQYNLALSGLKMTIAQQKRVCEMKLNFEITSQMKDMARMTSEFLNGMGSLSKDMVKLTKESDFKKITKQFGEAMMNMELQADQMETFMDETQSSFASVSTTSSEDNKEIEAMMGASSAAEESLDDAIEKELAELKKKMQ